MAIRDGASVLCVTRNIRYYMCVPRLSIELTRMRLESEIEKAQGPLVFVKFHYKHMNVLGVDFFSRFYSSCCSLE